MSDLSFQAKNVEDLFGVAEEVLKQLPDQRIFALKGVMGAGKTTLIKSFCEVLGTQEVVTSPTFALVNEYTDKNFDPVYHFDFYRIKKIDEVYDIGYEEYFFSDHYCFIEWPEMIEGLLPAEFVEVTIKEENDARTITCSKTGDS